MMCLEYLGCFQFFRLPLNVGGQYNLAAALPQFRLGDRKVLGFRKVYDPNAELLTLAF